MHKVTMGWYQALPIGELGAWHVKGMLDAVGESLENVSMWMEGIGVDSAIAFKSIRTFSFVYPLKNKPASVLIVV